MGNKQTGHAIATTASGYCFHQPRYPSLTAQHVNSLLNQEPSTGDASTSRGDGGHIDHITICILFQLRVCFTVQGRYFSLVNQ